MNYNHFFQIFEGIISYRTIGDPQTPAIMLIHGFLGDSRDWEEILPLFPEERFYILVELPGHGRSGLDSEGSMPSCAERIHRLLTALKIKTVSIVGYSMGGRVALQLASLYPEAMSSLALISSSLGIENEHERSCRACLDDGLAEAIETKSWPDFLDRWYRLPLFGTLRHHSVYASLIKRRREDHPGTLASALRQLSVGRHDYFDTVIRTLSSCVYITGELDKKYVAIGSLIQDLNPKARCYVLSEAGHAVFLEKPVEVAAYLAL